MANNATGPAPTMAMSVIIMLFMIFNRRGHKVFSQSVQRVIMFYNFYFFSFILCAYLASLRLKFKIAIVLNLI